VKWFLDVFLKSFKLNNQKNVITAKQAEIFERYVDFHTSEKGFLGLYGKLQNYRFELYTLGKSGKYYEIYIKEIN
jgi:hypothetical protein